MSYLDESHHIALGAAIMSAGETTILGSPAYRLEMDGLRFTITRPLLLPQIRVTDHSGARTAYLSIHGDSSMSGFTELQEKIRTIAKQFFIKNGV